MKSLRVTLALGFLTCPAMGQSSKPDSQVQQQILDELRALHRDVRAGATLQLLLAEMQIAQTSLDRAIQRRDAFKTQLTQVQSDKQVVQADFTRIQSATDNATNPDMREQLSERLEELRTNLKKVTTQENGLSEQLQDAERRLKVAQADREDIEHQLSDVVKKANSAS